MHKIEARTKPAYINFIDFKKAFDCIHAMGRCYGIPRKVTYIIYLMKSLYEGSSC